MLGSDLVLSRASLALDNLAGVVILLVLSFHSVLAYLNFLSASPFPFDNAPLSLARLSDRRHCAVVRLRSVLCMARRIFDVAVLLPLGPVRLAEPRAQGV